uniref:Ral guanine nucleotide dissociation stimulator-like 3 isoform X2 n=1 Tax=Geotrypetes seraphini TaxID=260995 RepID=A0A6P8P8S5_GEOSA|nr:ral guanine nucleotide dissociation stimulator-like 3 isoform X2 [Geotrypetes seraphini]
MRPSDPGMGKELSMSPFQEWGEEVEDDAVYNITLWRSKTDTPGREGSLATDTAEFPSSPGCDFVHYRTCKLRTLKAGTLPRLVQNLSAVYGSHDEGYIHSFLATYRTFTDTSSVLQLLLESSWPIGEGAPSSETQNLGCSDQNSAGAQCCDASEGYPEKMQSAVLYVLHTWLEFRPEDFREPPHYHSLRKAQTYLRKASRGAERDEGDNQAERLLQQFQEEEEEEEAEQDSFPQQLTFLTPEEETDGLLETPDLLSFTAEDVAEQLTLMDAKLFQKVESFHCLGCIWSQRDKDKNLAPTVRATVAQFNSVAGCVTASVLADVQLKGQQRAKVLEKWISIAQKCRLLRNFSSLRAILSALQSNPIYRLKRTWAAVNRDTISIFHKLSSIFSDENNHMCSREILVQEEDCQATSAETSCREDCKHLQRLSPSDQPVKSFPATVPYLGTFLTDLVMLDTALPDLLENGWINFDKRRKEFETLSMIQKLQLSCQHYRLSAKPLVLATFHQHRQLTEDQSYRMSRSIEPPANSCPNSPRIRRRLTKRFSSLLMGSEALWPRINGERGNVSPSGSWSSCDAEDSPGYTLPSPDGGPAPKGVQDLPLACSAAILPLDDSFLVAVAQAKEPPSPGVSLPIYNRQMADLCIIRVSVENDTCNLYRSILLTSQDKAPAVILRALQKHNLEQSRAEDFQLVQLLAESKELVIPDSANVYYAMCTAGNFDFLLRRKEGPKPKSPCSPLLPPTLDGPSPQRLF